MKSVFHFQFEGDDLVNHFS